MTMSTTVSVIDRIILSVFKQPVPDTISQFHRRVYRDLSSKAWHLQRLHTERFDNEEFVQYLRIKRDIYNNQGNYQDLRKSIELLELALTAKDSFLLIAETEMRFRSSTQQKFYQFITQLLQKSYDRKKISTLMRTALKRVFLNLKTPEGRMVMKEYVLAIEKVTKDPLGLELLRSFKQDNLERYNMLANVSKIAKTLKKSDLINIKKLTILIQENRDDFDELGDIIEIPFQHHLPASYARMLQYIALKHRYAKSTMEFNEMIRRLADWEKSFVTLIEIREEYTSQKYRLSKEFTQKIPAIKIYQKYQSYLDDYRNEFR